MSKIIGIVLTLFIFLTCLNLIFVYESFKKDDIREFYLTGELSEDYTLDEQEHMEDVKSVGIFSLFLNFVLFIIFIRQRSKISSKKVGFYLFVIFGLLVLFALFFEKFFYYFHLVFFGSNGWTFPSSSKLIQNFPFEFFRNRFLLFSLLVFLFGVIFTGWRVIFERFPKKPKRN